MRGHDTIIALRRRGIMPSIVFINDYPCDVDWFKFNDHAKVEILPTEAVDRLDMRFVIGMTVSISSENLERAQAISQACKSAGAAVVAAGCSQKIGPTGRYENVWAEVWRRPVQTAGQAA